GREAIGMEAFALAGLVYAVELGDSLYPGRAGKERRKTAKADRNRSGSRAYLAQTTPDWHADVDRCRDFRRSRPCDGGRGRGQCSNRRGGRRTDEAERRRRRGPLLSVRGGRRRTR